MAKFKNVSDSPALLNAVPQVLVQPGEEVEADLSNGEVAALEQFGIFEAVSGRKAKAEPAKDPAA